MEHGYIVLSSLIPLPLINALVREVNTMMGSKLIANTNDPRYISSTSENRESNGKLIFNCRSTLTWQILYSTQLFGVCQGLFGGNNTLQEPLDAQLAVRFPLSLSEDVDMMFPLFTNSRHDEEEASPDKDATTAAESIREKSTSLFITQQIDQQMKARQNMLNQDLSRDHWHIDGQWESNIPQFSLLVGVYLTPCPEKGCGSLTVFPGSHRRVQSMLNEDYEGVCAQLRSKVAPALNTADDIAPIELSVEVGDVVLAHPLLAHRAGENWSSRTRLALYYRLSTTSFNTAIKEAMLKDLYVQMEGLRMKGVHTAPSDQKMPIAAELSHNIDDKYLSPGKPKVMDGISIHDVSLSSCGVPSQTDCCYATPPWSPVACPTPVSVVYLITGAGAGIGRELCQQIFIDTILRNDKDVFIIVGVKTKEQIFPTFDQLWNDMPAEAKERCSRGQAEVEERCPRNCRVGVASVVLDVSNEDSIRCCVDHLTQICPVVSQVALLSLLNIIIMTCYFYECIPIPLRVFYLLSCLLDLFSFICMTLLSIPCISSPLYDRVFMCL
jgi:ectoine hydroxylase-related dioxygenase (phytanoyl-CoA dioxygenase family)